MARIDLTLLGGFQARLNPGPLLRVGTRKAQGLLAYLALPRGLAHPRDKLASLLWGDMRQEQARTNLRQTLFNLRKALPATTPESLHQDGAHVALDPTAVDVDVATFETLVTRGTPEALAQAAALYQGDLLEGLAVHETPFEEWLMAERERLRELALEALAKLLAQQRTVGKTEAALRTAVRLIALDPLLETVHRTLMRLYVELGRRAAALRQYQICVKVLKRELGVGPEVETRGLYQDILRSEERHGALRGAQANTLAPPASVPAPTAPIIPVATPTPAATPIRCDQRLLTLLAARLDAPEDRARVQLACMLQDLVAKAESFGARIEEITASSLLAVFGIDPMEDAPRRAVHAARVMLQALRSAAEPSLGGLTGRCAIHAGRYLAASAGPAAGLGTQGRDRAQSILDALLAQAGPNSVVLDQAAARFVERRFALERIGHAPAAGYRVVGGERLGFGGGERPLTPLVGRERDLDMLSELLRRAEPGEAQSVGLVGDPGVGKSRLVYEFLHSLEPGRVSYLEGRCLAHGSAMPYLPIVELVRGYFGVIDTEPQAAIVAKLSAGLQRLDLDPNRYVAYLLHLLGVREGTENLQLSSSNVVKDRALDTLKHVVQAESRRRLLLIVVEDLHWIDPTSEAVLESIVESLVGCPMMLLTTYRPGYRPPWLGRSYVSQLVVPRLTRADSLTVVRSVRPDLPAPLAEQVVAHGDGVPFFLEELARVVVSDIDVKGGVRIADTVEDVLLARLDRLPADDRKVLETAAVIGKDVLLPVLEAAMDVPPDPLHESLRRLQGGEFIYQTRVFPTAEYTFRHALTHDVAYESLPHEQRRAQHARSAWAIEALLPDTCERQPEVLARHYTLAGQRQPAIDHWHRAAQRALERGAYAEALMHVRSGLELLEQFAETSEGMRQELGLQLALGTVLLRTQGFTFPEVERAFARARALCHQIQDSPELFPVLWGLWQIHMSRGELGPAEKLGAQLLNVAERRPDPVLLLGAHGAVGSSLLFRGELAEAREHFERALVLYMPDSSASHAIIIYGHEIGSSTLALLGLTLALQGFQERAGEVGSLALAQGRRVAHPFSLAFALHVVATTCLVTRDAQVAGELGEEELAISREHGFPLFAAGGLWFTAYALVVRGERDRGFELMDEAARAYEAAGAWGPADLPRDCTVAELLIEAGRLEAAMDVIRVALAHSEQGRRWFHAELVRIQGTALLRQEDRDESQAEQCFLEAIELARHQGARTLELRAAISLARLWAQQGKRVAARDELGNVYGGFPEGRDSVDLRSARALLDGLCKARV